MKDTEQIMMDCWGAEKPHELQMMITLNPDKAHIAACMKEYATEVLSEAIKQIEELNKIGDSKELWSIAALLQLKQDTSTILKIKEQL